MADCPYLSGKNGTIKIDSNTVLHISNWQISKSSNNSAVATNNTNGWKARTCGVKDSTGSFTYVIPFGNASMPVAEGSCVEAQFHTDGTATNYYSQTIIIDQVDLESDINDGNFLEYNVTFSGAGPLTDNGYLVESGS